MKDTKIRWTDSSWNPMVGCTRVSPGCDHCYAEALVERWGPASTAFPNGFEPTFKPKKVGIPGSWREPRRIFVNSMSDVFHEAFTDEQIDAVFDEMLAVPRHDYQVLTKRHARMVRYMNGNAGYYGVGGEPRPGYLERRGLLRLPSHIWLGVSIENDQYTFRARQLGRVNAGCRFLSIEPMLGPVPSLSLEGIDWVIVGGESGPGWRPLDPQWARDVRDLCLAENVPFFYKQGAAFRTEHNVELDGQRWEQFPRPHPTTRLVAEARQLALRTE